LNYFIQCYFTLYLFNEFYPINEFLINLGVKNQQKIEMKNIDPETISVTINKNHKIDLIGETTNSRESNFAFKYSKLLKK
jgi:hypothetical protein